MTKYELRVLDRRGVCVGCFNFQHYEVMTDFLYQYIEREATDERREFTIIPEKGNDNDL